MNRRDLVSLFVVSPTMVLAGCQAPRANPTLAPVPDARTTHPLTPPAVGEILVAVVLSKGAEVVDFTGPWGVFDYVFLGENFTKPFKLYTVAATTDPVTVSAGMKIVPTYTFANAPQPHVVVVPAMDDDNLAPGLLDWLRATSKRTDVTMSVCNGSIVLAEAGLLDGKRATAHHQGYGLLRSASSSTTVVRGARYVEDGTIATAGGLTSGADLALRVVERYFGREVARDTARRLEYQGTGWMHPDSNVEFATPVVPSADEIVCPICEMPVPHATAVTWDYKGTTHHFCGDWCKARFQKHPHAFLAPH